MRSLVKIISNVRPIAAFIVIADIVLVRAWIYDGLSSFQVIFGHFVTAIIFGLLLFALRKEDRERTLVTVLFALLLGPLGGLMLVIIDLGEAVTALPISNSSKLAAQPSRAEKLHLQILQGRRRLNDGSPPDAFIEVFSSGSLKRQQAAIAAISRSYSPEMLPALKIALASDVPMLRVQAAAVFAKLRGTFSSRAKAIRAVASRGPLAPEHAVEAETVAASGFVDTDTAVELRALTRVQPQQTPLVPPKSRPELAKRAGRFPSRPPHLKRYSCGGIA